MASCSLSPLVHWSLCLKKKRRSGGSSVLLVFWPLGPWVHFSLSLLVPWSLVPLVLAPLVFWSLGLLVPRSLGPLFPWSLVPLVRCSFGPLVPRTHVPLVPWPLGLLFLNLLVPWFLGPLFHERNAGKPRSIWTQSLREANSADHCRNLSFQDRPGYVLLQRLLKKMLLREGPSCMAGHC